MPKLVFGDHTPQSLLALALRLSELKQEFDALADRMTQHGLEMASMPYHKEMLRGFETFEAFIEGGKRAIKRALKERGDYGVQVDDDADDKKKPRRKRGRTPAA